MNIREDKIYLHKRCFEHGEFEALVYGDAQAYLQTSAILHRGWAFAADPEVSPVGAENVDGLS